MKIIEIATGYTPIPAKVGAATEIVITNLIYEFNNLTIQNELIDITFSKNKQISDITNTHYIRLSKKLDTINDNGFIHYLRRILYSIKVGLLLKKYLKKQDDKIVLHFHNQFNFFFTYLIAKKVIKRKKVQILYTVHSPSWSIFNKIPIKLALEKYAIQKADFVISLTHIIKQKVIKLVGIRNTNKISVIPNGVSSTIYKPIPDLEKENNIFNVGSICERKNQLETIKILEPFLKKNIFRFLFVGKIVEANYFKKIKKYIKENNLDQYVLYLGEIEPGEKLNELYNTSKFYVSCSKQEAFTLVVLESMSAGLPVVLSQTFNSFLDKSDPLRKVIKILPDNRIEKELDKILQSQETYDAYRRIQMDCIHDKYDWNNIAKQIIQKIS